MILGLIFFVGAVNGFFFLFGIETLLPESPEAINFLGDGYLLVMVKSLELIGAILLFSNRYVPLALLTLLPITVNIVAFHVFVDPGLLLLVVIMLFLHLFLLFSKKESYQTLLVK